MVALLLNHVPGSQGLTKERLMVLAEETGVAGSESMSGDGGYYNGWSGMSQMLVGDPALVRKEKGHRFSLTTQVIPISFQYLDVSIVCQLLKYCAVPSTPATRDEWTCYCKRSPYSCAQGRNLHVWKPTSRVLRI